MKVTVVCTHAEESQAESEGKRIVIHRGRFEAATVEEAPENKGIFHGGPAISVDLARVLSGSTGFKVGDSYVLELLPKKRTLKPGTLKPD